MIVTIIIVSLFVFKAPDYAWMSVPIRLAYLFIKSKIKESLPEVRDDEYEDEYEMWQDDEDL